MRYMKKRNAFTLIELLVVISIIALLMAILMPALSRVRSQAKQVICQSNLSQWGLIFGLYLTENNYTFMKGWTGNYDDRSGQWMYALRDYTSQSHDVWCCPEANNEEKCLVDKRGRTAHGGSPTSKTPWGHLSSAQHGTYDTDAGDYGSYGINSWVCSTGLDSGDPKYWNKVTSINEPLQTIPLFMDAMYCELWPESRNNPPREMDGVNNSPDMSMAAIDRHTGTGIVNMVFADSSVRKVGIKELWTLKWHRTFNTKDRWTIAGNNGSSETCKKRWDINSPWLSGYPEY
jgi:prepilin-type N-terminal cleavage/methylation domain-containing protein